MQMFGTFAVVWSVLQYLQDNEDNKKKRLTRLSTLSGQGFSNMSPKWHTRTNQENENDMCVWDTALLKNDDYMKRCSALVAIFWCAAAAALG